MLYTLFKTLLKTSLDQYFSSIKITGEPLIEEGPLLVAVNHPNFMLDSLLVGGAFKRDLWFVGKGTLFSNPLAAWLLRRLHLIPIFRRQDNPAEMSKNDKSFDEVCSHLLSGRGVVIFPEGKSLGERRLSPLKTGVARMAFLALEKSSFALPIKVQPVGLTYGVLSEFRSSVTIVGGRALELELYSTMYRSDPAEAVRALTADIEQALSSVTVIVENAENEALVEQLGKLYSSRGSALNDHERLTLIARNVASLAPRYPEEKARIEEKLGNLVSLLPFAGREGDNSKLFFFLAGPAIVLGVLFCWPPYRLTGIAAEHTSTHPVDLSSWKLTFGALFFLLWFALWIGGVILVSGSFLLGLVWLCILLILALFANRYGSGALRLLGFGSANRSQSIEEERDALIAELESIRVH